MLREAPSFPVVLFAGSSFEMGGMESHLAQLGVGLVRRGYTVAAIFWPREQLTPLRHALEESGVHVHVDAGLEDGSTNSPIRRARRLLNLFQTLRKYPGCALHLHLGTPESPADLITMAGWLARVRTIVRTEHNPPTAAATRRTRIIARLRDRLLDRVICVSEQNRQEFVTQLHRDARKCVVVNNGVDLARFSPTADMDGIHAELGFDDTAPIIGTVSRLTEHRKGLTHFIEMAAIVSRTHPGARFLIVGDGPLRGELEDQVRALGLAGRVVFTGRRRDVPRLLTAMRVFVTPSYYEGAAYALLEAMAMARPVISTPVGLAPELIHHGVTGLLAPISNSEALAGAVRELLADERRATAMGQRGRDLVASRYSTDVMVDHLIDVYREAAGERDRRLPALIGPVCGSRAGMA